MFETSPPKPQKLLGDVLMIVLAYTISVFAGHILMKKGWSSFVWVSIVGSILLASIKVGLALPVAIEHYNRFKPEESLPMHLIWAHGVGLFWIAVAFSLVTFAASFVARFFRSLFGNLPYAR